MRFFSQKCLKNLINKATCVFVFLLMSFAATSLSAAELSGQALMDRIKQGGVVLMMRHAQTVAGTGDPPGFKLTDCATQRNLSDEGRAQARRAGEVLKAAGIVPRAVLSSAWCRCKETADLMFGRHTVEPALNSFFDDRSSETKQTAALKKRLQSVSGKALPEVWITHQVNTTALTGLLPAMGEILVLQGGGDVQVLGRLAF
jgi:phosphohistidine phosphatase SixA